MGQGSRRFQVLIRPGCFWHGACFTFCDAIRHTLVKPCQWIPNRRRNRKQIFFPQLHILNDPRIAFTSVNFVYLGSPNGNCLMPTVHSLLLPHCYCLTATASLLLPHCYCLTATASLLLPHCSMFAVTCEL
jgi:hypothetical protein